MADAKPPTKAQPQDWSRFIVQHTPGAVITTDARGRITEFNPAAEKITGYRRREAIGQPALLYVVVPDQPWRLAAGAVFSYYEFTVAPEGRMTDEAWQAMEESGQAPPLPDWTSLFFLR